MTERDIFIAALHKRGADERAAFLDEACQGEPDLRERLEELLREHDQLGSFLEPPGQEPVAALAAPVREGPGTMLGSYKLLEQIGEGGMGAVWMAEQTQPVRRKVALKVIKTGMDSQQVIARFEAERQALALMDHPNIARVFDAGTAADGRPFFVMELVKGVPLTRYCDEHHLTPRQRLELFLPVCHAIQHAHQKGIIHRDLKPNNVLIARYDERPVPKVIDFGVAKATGQQLTEQTLHTGFGAIVGTVEYMSPEQASFNQLDVDTRSDIYSLGVLLYELLAGSPPFSRKELETAGLLEVLRLIREQEPSRPSTKLSTADGLPALAANRGTEPKRLTALVRGDLDWIVMKSLEKDRTRRYETAGALAQDLQHHLADEPVRAGPPSAAYRLRKSVKRHRRSVSAAAVVLAALVAGVIGTTWGMVEALAARKEEARQRQTAEERVRDLWRQRYPADISAAHRAWQAGNLKQARDLLTRYLPREGQEELRGFEWYFLWDQCRSLEMRTLEGHTGTVYCAAFSPNGGLLASCSEDHTIRLWDVASGTPRLTLKGHTGPVYHVSFSRDGKSLASWSEDGTARFWDVTGQRPPVSWSAVNGTVTGAGFMPDGTSLAFVLREGAFELWDVNANRKRVFPHPWGHIRFLSGAASRDGKRLALGDNVNRVSIWDMEAIWDADKQRLLRTFPLSNAVRELDMHPDGKLVAAATDSGLVHVLGLDPFREMATLTGHEMGLRAVAISPDGSTLASGDDDGVRLWDIPSRMVRAVIRRGHSIRCLAFSPHDGRSLAVGGIDGSLRLYSLSSRPPVERMSPDQPWDWIGALKFSPDGQTLAVGTFLPTTQMSHLWDRKTGKPQAPQTHGNALSNPGYLCYSPDSKTLAVTTNEGVVLWDAVTGHRRGTPLAGSCQAFTTDNQLVVTGSTEGEIRLWDAANGAPRGRFAKQQPGVTCVACAPNGRTLASGHADGQVWLWNLVTGQRHDEQLPRHDGLVRFLLFAADGHTLITASNGDDRIYVWDLDQKRLRLSFTGWSSRVCDMGLSPDGKTLAVAGRFRVTLFHVATGQELFTLEKHSTCHPSVNFSADGDTLVTGFAAGNELIVWRAPRVGLDGSGEIARTAGSR